MVLKRIYFIFSFGLLITTFNVGAAPSENDVIENKDSYLEICEKGEIHRIAPSNTHATKLTCEDIVQFNFQPGETVKRIRVFGVFLVLDSRTGCPKRLLFGHGQCKDIHPGIALRLMKDGIWHDAENKTFSIMFNIMTGTIQALRLPNPNKEIVKIPQGTTFFTLSGDVADLPEKGAYCLLEDHVNHTRIISQRHVMSGGTIQIGGTPDECPYEKYFKPSLHTSPSAINLPKQLESCNLACETEQQEGAGPGPLDNSEAKAEKIQSSREDTTIPPHVINDPLATVSFESADTEITTPFVEDNIATTLAPLHPDDDEVPIGENRRKRREIGYKGPIVCVKTFANKCTTGIGSFNLTTLEKLFG